MKTVLRQLRNSPAISHTTTLLKKDEYQLARDGELAVIKYDLDSLIKGINAKNRYIESDFGSPESKVEISH